MTTLEKPPFNFNSKLTVHLDPASTQDQKGVVSLKDLLIAIDNADYLTEDQKKSAKREAQKAYNLIQKETIENAPKIVDRLKDIYGEDPFDINHFQNTIQMFNQTDTPERIIEFLWYAFANSKIEETYISSDDLAQQWLKAVQIEAKSIKVIKCN